MTADRQSLDSGGITGN